MMKMRCDESVNLAILDRICGALECDFGDVIERIENME